MYNKKKLRVNKSCPLNKKKLRNKNVFTIKRSQEIKMCPYSKKKLKIKNCVLK